MIQSVHISAALRMIVLIFSMFLLACEQEDIYLYEVNPVEVSQPGVEKSNQKSDLEFLSLAFADLFGTTISSSQLNTMVQAYESMGDKTLIADIIIRNLLSAPGAKIPTNAEMRADLDEFINQTYKKFFIRLPGEYESWYLRQLITEDPDFSPEMVYYAFLTSDEYRYY